MFTYSFPFFRSKTGIENMGEIWQLCKVLEKQGFFTKRARPHVP
jgi:hypothetical protein